MEPAEEGTAFDALSIPASRQMMLSEVGACAQLELSV